MTSSHRLRPVLLLVLVVALAFAASLFGQTLKGTILGTVTDVSGGVIPGAQVVITETGTNAARTTTTNDSGLYVFANLDPGVYRVDVEHEGFRRITRPGIDLAPNNTVRIELEMTPGLVTESVEVTAAAAVLKTDRADTGGQIEHSQLQNMPLGINRNYVGTMITIPGVSKPRRLNSEFFNSQDSMNSEINGQSNAQNNFQIEGIDNNVENGALTGIVPPVEAIQTVDISTTDYDSELGRAGGGVVNVTLRSGTNEFHGSLFEFNKVGKLQASDVFATAKPPIVYNQFGGVLGGPIVRDKTFFFVDYQGTRDHKGQTNLQTIPNIPFRSGNFSGGPTTIFDPTTGTPDGRGRTAFLNNSIPSDRISPIARQLLSFIEAPTRPGDVSNFEKDTIRVKTLDQFDMKFDHAINADNRFMGRYSYQEANVIDPGLYGPDNGIYGGPHNSGRGGFGPARTQSLGLNYSRVWSPTLVSEMRLGVNRNYNTVTPWDYGTKPADKLGIPGANLDQFSSGLPGFNVTGFDTPMLGTINCIPWIRANTAIAVATNFTKTYRNHVIKFGYDLKRYRRDLRGGLSSSIPRGQFTFSGSTTALNGGPNSGYANAFAAFLLDYVNQIDRGEPTTFPTRRDWVHSPYFQDKWQVLPRLTLDLGLRWEYWPASKPAHPGGFAAYNPANNTIEIAGLGNIPMDLGVSSPKKSFAPRIGLAYRINPLTVFRAGYGISYLTRALSNYSFPVAQTNTYTPANPFSWAGRMVTGVPVQDVPVFPSNGIISPAPTTVVTSPSEKNIPHAYVQTWNISLQRSLPQNFTMDAAYVGSRGVGGLTNFDTNASPLLGCARACQPFFILYGRSASVIHGVGNRTWYNALQVKVDRRFAGGFMLTTAYTYSHNIDQFEHDVLATPGSLQVLQILDRERAAVDYRHIFTQSYIYELPFGHSKRWAQSGIPGAALGGWKLNGLLYMQTGYPLLLAASAAGLASAGHITTPTQVGSSPVKIFGATGPGQLWFDTSRFQQPLPLTFGNAGNNVLNGPGVINLDASVFRQFRVRERVNLEFRVEGLNATNTPTFGSPVLNVTAPGFGQITTSRTFADFTTNSNNRIVQFGLKLFF